jgi:hypothetical protein
MVLTGCEMHSTLVGKSSFINWYIGEQVCKTGVAIETRGFILCTSGRLGHKLLVGHRHPGTSTGIQAQASRHSCMCQQRLSACSTSNDQQLKCALTGGLVAVT